MKRDADKMEANLGNLVQTDLVNFILWMRKGKLNTFSNWLELNNIVKAELGPDMSIRHLVKLNK